MDTAILVCAWVAIVAASASIIFAIGAIWSMVLASRSRKRLDKAYTDFLEEEEKEGTERYVKSKRSK